MAIGPTLCSILVKASGTPAAAVVLVLVVHIFNLAAILFVIPESLSEARKTENKQLRQEANARSRERSADSGTSIRSKLLSYATKAFSFVKPLAIVGPIGIVTGSGRVHRDFSMTFIAISACFASIILASNQTLFLFAFHTFSWTAVKVSLTTCFFSIVV